MKHNLPELFRHIIEFDNAKPDVYAKVASMSDVKEWRDRRAELSAAAAQFVKRQRGSGGTT